MSKIYRIVEKYEIETRGIVCIIEKNIDCFKIGDLFYDLHGHKFKLISLGLLQRVESTEIILKPVDKSGIIGNILVKEYPCINFLFSSHPLMFKMVDDDYESEFNIARKKFKCGLFSLERFLEDKKFVYGDKITGLTIYRGWMLSVEVYQKMYIELEKIGIYLINTPEEYERYHHLPKWYDDFKDFTPYSIWNNSNNLDDALELTENLSGSYIVKDYVKSRKHEWYDACFIKDIENKQKTREILSNFINRQDDMLAGGVVLRKFEKLKGLGHHEKSGMPISEEYRVFVYAGRILTIDNYWEKTSINKLSTTEIEWIKSIANQIKSNFMTIDLARKEDGKLIVMELGDGQVSGLQQLEPQNFYCAFNT